MASIYDPVMYNRETPVQSRTMECPKQSPTVCAALYGLVLVWAVLLVAMMSGSAGASRSSFSLSRHSLAGQANPNVPAASPDCWVQVANDSENATFSDVDVISSTEVLAVGSSSGVGLVSRWDGASWSQAYVGSGAGYLQAVRALSVTDIWAVGASGTPTESAWSLHSDGSTWVSVPVTAPTATGSQLYDITVLNEADAWAVGSYTRDYVDYPLIEHWDGLTWTQWPFEGTGTLRGIYASSSGDIWAVGDQHLPEPFALHWDGLSWSEVPVPPSGESSLFSSVSGTSASDIWAVGSTTVSAGTSVPLIMHWDGTGWREVAKPSISPSSSSSPQIYFGGLSSVVALSPTDAWAVGGAVYSVFRDPLILRWDGANWNSAYTQQFDLTLLQGVDAISSTVAWAVGDTRQRQSPGAFTARYQEGPCPTPTAIVEPTPCPIRFSDVQPTDYFYQAVLYLSCHNAISGYSDGTFRPYNNTTRGQAAKIVVLGFGIPIDTSGGPHFSDVPTTSPFYEYVETANHNGIVSGYADGTFRPYNNVTRGQLSKIVTVAAIQVNHWTLQNPPNPTFTDVEYGSPFYRYVETADLYGVVSGYSDGTFRPGNDATRGQISKIIYMAITQPRALGRYGPASGRHVAP